MPCPSFRCEKRTAKELTAAQRATRQLLDALDRKLLERYTRGDKKLEALFDGDVTPLMLIRKGITFALSPSSIPAEKDLAMSLVEIGGDPETGTLSRQPFHRDVNAPQDTCFQGTGSCSPLQTYATCECHQGSLSAASAADAKDSMISACFRLAFGLVGLLSRSTWCPEGSRRVTQKRSKGLELNSKIS